LLNIFDSLITTDSTTSISITGFVACILAAILFGLIISKVFQYKNTSTKSFLATLAVLPAVVGVVIMMVNGSIGAGIAVAGAFSLIRFRSVPGTAKEISAIFVAMAVGLSCGMGYIGYGFIFTLIISVLIIVLEKTNFGSQKNGLKHQVYRITIPEDLDYTHVFDGIFKKYTNEYTLEQVKTTNMGSLFRLTYTVEMKKEANEKALIDELRTRNGNLEITSSVQSTINESL